MDIKQIFQQVPPFAGSKGLVFIDDSYVLVCERDNHTDFYPDHDDLPGGCQEPGETPFQTFERELIEELGVQVAPEEISYAVAVPDIDNESETLFFMVANLRNYHRNQVHFGNEGRGYKVMHLDKVLTDNKYIPAYQQLIKDYLKYVEDHRQPLRNNKAKLADHLLLT